MRTNWPAGADPRRCSNSARKAWVPSVVSILLARKLILPAFHDNVAVGHDQLDTRCPTSFMRPPGEFCQAAFAEAEAHPDRVGLVDRGAGCRPSRSGCRPTWRPPGGAGNRAVTVVHDRFSSAWRSAAWAMALAETASS